MVPLTPDVRKLLAQMGDELDRGCLPEAYDEGVMWPGSPSAEDQSLGQEKENGRSRWQGGSAAGPRQGSARGKGASPGARRSVAAPRFSRAELRAEYEGQVKGLKKAYPKLQDFPDDDGMWLLVDSLVMEGLTRKATFLVAIPYHAGAAPVTWGFWSEDGKIRWIGPRHTNFHGGSICAFAPDDGVWSDGGCLKTLLNVYSCWALRHLHLEAFDRWPGKQYGLLGVDSLTEARYRLHECNDNELCGCGSETRRYVECCKPKDLLSIFTNNDPRSRLAFESGLSTRQPPRPVVDFIEGRAELPKMRNIHHQIR